MPEICSHLYNNNNNNNNNIFCIRLSTYIILFRNCTSVGDHGSAEVKVLC